MEEMAINLIQQAGQLTRLASPLLLVSIIPLLMFTLAGMPGRAVLEVETRLEMHRERRRRENARTSRMTVGNPSISGAEVNVPA